MITSAKTIDDTDKKIIHGLRRGMVYKEIGSLHGITETRIKKRLHAMRIYYECGNNTQLVLKLIELALIE
jgi:DNA-binding CsgD family transcriptional regulator